jgi:multidrug efflux pump subunit AcrB
MTTPSHRLGMAGALTRAFITSPLTPLFLIAALAFGLLALFALPREEEPQISVPMVDILVRADGLRADDAVKLVTEPLEVIVKGIDGVEHVYSQTGDDSVLVTARFLVGTSADAAVLRVHDKIRANMDRIPVGIPEPQIVGRGIDDVAIVSLTLTLTPTPEAANRIDANKVTRIARELRRSASSLTRQDWRSMASPCNSSPARYRARTAPSRRAICAMAASRSCWLPARHCRRRRRSATCF